MDSKTFEHRGFTGTAEVSVRDKVLHGKILHIDDLVTYEGVTVEELRASFVAAVDDYIADFEAEGKAIPAPFKGSFNVRVGAELHRSAANLAVAELRSLNDLVKSAIEIYVECRDVGRHGRGFALYPYGAGSRVFAADDLSDAVVSFRGGGQILYASPSSSLGNVLSLPVVEVPATGTSDVKH